MAAKKRSATSTGKSNARKKVVRKKNTDGMSEAEHGQGWERDEVVECVADESEPVNGNGDEDEVDDEDDVDED